jgi:hypothetical protein
MKGGRCSCGQEEIGVTISVSHSKLYGVKEMFTESHIKSVYAYSFQKNVTMQFTDILLDCYDEH